MTERSSDSGITVISVFTILVEKKKIFLFGEMGGGSRTCATGFQDGAVGESDVSNHVPLVEPAIGRSEGELDRTLGRREEFPLHLWRNVERSSDAGKEQMVLLERLLLDAKRLLPWHDIGY